MDFYHDYDLQPHNSMAVTATAKHFVRVTSESELQQALQYAQERDMPLIALGEGSNTLFSGNVDALVVAVAISKRQVLDEDDESIVLCLGAGENWHDVVAWTLEQQWYGLERLALIPGAVGAAPIQNIGAYGMELEQVFVELQCVDIATLAKTVCGKEQCGFGYRDSIFKNQWSGKKVITSVTLRLSKTRYNYQLEELYPALQAHFAGADDLSPEQVFDAVCATRQAKLPDPEVLPNSGSFFKNPLVSNDQYQKLLQQFPDIVSYAQPKGRKLAAGWLIERAGFKGEFDINGVGSYEKQALVLINPEKRSGKDVLAFAHKVRSAVQEKFAVDLEIEPRVY